MKIDGKQIAQTILSDLKQRVDSLKKQGITPHLAIILIGNNPVSEAYVKQKVLKGQFVGIKVTVKQFSHTVNQQNLLTTIKQLNNDNNVHGVIVQRPLPDHIDEEAIASAVLPEKDVDGFHPQSKFQMPLAQAVLKILESVFIRRPLASQGDALQRSFRDWLVAKKVIVIGKGKTGGGPVLSALAKLGVKPLIVDSKTQNPQELTKAADIIISTVGKPNVVTADMIKKGAVVIGVGMYRGEDGKLHGDYEEEAIKNVAGFYTPVPGGVGPVNVAMLLQNVVKAAESFAS